MRWYRLFIFTLAACAATCAVSQTFTIEQPKAAKKSETRVVRPNEVTAAHQPESTAKSTIRIAEENASPSAAPAKRAGSHHARAASKIAQKLEPKPVVPPDPEVATIAPVRKPPPPLQPVPSLTSLSNSELQQKIEASLHRLPSSRGMRVSVSENEIRLDGTVANGKEKLEAARLAQSYSGNRLFKDELQIAGSQRVTAAQPVNSNAGMPSTVGNSFTPPRR